MTAPDWTDFNQNDPGIALLELFSFLGEELLTYAQGRRRRRRRGAILLAAAAAGIALLARARVN